MMIMTSKDKRKEQGEQVSAPCLTSDVLRGVIL